MQPALFAPGIGVVAMGAAILVQQALPLYWGSQSTRWPHVHGRITGLNTLHYQVDRGVDDYMPNIRYEYTVNGQPFTGNTVAYGRSYFRQGAANLATRFAPGTAVAVYYDPTVRRARCWSRAPMAHKAYSWPSA